MEINPVKLEDGDNKLYVQTGYNNGDNYQTGGAFGTTLSTGVWYHITLTLDSSNSYRLRVWDDTAGDLLDDDRTGTFLNTISIEASDLVIGALHSGGNYLKAYVDEVVVFDEVLSVSEIDQIRAETYSATR